MALENLMKTDSNTFDQPSIRIGLLVPSSNVTMETEIPLFLNALQKVYPNKRFTVHSSRVRMRNVTRDELIAMNSQADRAALELADAGVDVILYACLIAVMIEGKNAHCTAEERLEKILYENGHSIPVVSSAGALIRTISAFGLKKICVLTPYAPELTTLVCDYIHYEGAEVVHAVSRSVTDNKKVGLLSMLELKELALQCPETVDATILSACVQMPSADIIEDVERVSRKPVITAATATFYQAMRKLGIETSIKGFGQLLGGTLIAKN